MYVFPQYLAQQVPMPDFHPRGGFQGLTDFSIQRLVVYGIQLVLVLAAIVFFFIFIAGGVKWISSAGDKMKVEAARHTITNALTGLLIVFSVFAVIFIINQMFGVNIGNLGTGPTPAPTAPPPGPTSPPTSTPLPGPAETNCADSVDNDGDGNTDAFDSDCECSNFCTCPTSEGDYATWNCSGDTVYVDCHSDACWSSTASSQYGVGAADNYCNNLVHGGFIDWILPNRNALGDLCNSGSCDGTGICFGSDGYSDQYASSSIYSSGDCYRVDFGFLIQHCGFYGSGLFGNYYVRCIR